MENRKFNHSVCGFNDSRVAQWNASVKCYESWNFSDASLLSLIDGSEEFRKQKIENFLLDLFFYVQVSFSIFFSLFKTLTQHHSESNYAKSSSTQLL